MSAAWLEETRSGGISVFRPSSLPAGLLVAFSGRGVAPPEETSPTAYLARRFARSLALEDIPIARTTQVHGNRSVLIDESPAADEVFDAGECDALTTGLPGIALAVQTADCVPIALAGDRSVGIVHAGWRGAAKGVVASGIRGLAQLGEDPSRLSAWIGPSIGACCYEVGGEVASQFAGEFLRRECGGKFRLDLKAVGRAQLEAAGVPAAAISVQPACTKCGGAKYASYRRDGAKAGRMIGLVARFAGALGVRRKA